VHGVRVEVSMASLVRPCVMAWLGWALFRILLQVLSRMLGKLSLLCPLLKSEDQAGWHVSFPEGMVLCMPGQGLGLLP